MTIVNFLMGGFLIAMGFLVKRYPDLIAGYNTMSPEKKRKVDIIGLSTFMRDSFIVMGVMVMLIHPFVYLLGMSEHSIGVVIATILIGTFAMAIYGQRFKHRLMNEKSKKPHRMVGISLIFGAITIMTLGFLYYGTRPPKIDINNKQIAISGLYGLAEQVERIELIDELPRVILKTNGFNYGSILKGNFKVETYGKCRLFIQSREGPYIYLNTDRGIPIIINTKSKRKTRELADQLIAERLRFY